MTNQQKGFTLTEITIVVAILAILGVALLVGINPIAQIFKGYDARRKSDLSEIKIALEAYYSDHDCYPEFTLVNGLPTYTCDSTILSPYLKSMPCDPNSKSPYTIYLNPIGACPQNFAVYAKANSLFDKQANSIPYCPKTFSANSQGIREIDLVNGCSNMTFSDKYYGCKDSACVIVADGTIPSCSPNTVDDDCGAGSTPIPVYCARPNNICK